ncbi:MAG: CAP domain-containing protein [Terriglobales bacterium]
MLIGLLTFVAIILICGTANSAFAQQIQLANVPSTLASGQCSSAVYVKLYQGKKVVKAASNIVVDLASTGASSLAFFSKSTCTNHISSVAIAEGATQIKFFFSSSQPGVGTMNVSAQGLNAVAANVTISSAAVLGVEESEMVRTINRVRRSIGLTELQASTELTNAALWMANDMASNAWTSADMENSNNNYDADSLGRNLWQRVSAFGYFGGAQPYNGEMLIGGQPDALSTFYEPNVVYELNTAFTVPYATAIGVAHVYAQPMGWYWVVDFGGTNVDQTLNLSPAPAPNQPTQVACSAWNNAQPSSWTTNWTGNIASCNAGTIDSGSIQGTLSLVNYYRNLAGLPAVVENSTWDQEAQACALIEDANFNTYGLSNSPQSSWQCYSSSGAIAAAQSNLASLDTQSSVSVYMEDPGNPFFGHRSWILSNNFSTVGVGSTTTASCLKVEGGSPIPNPQPWVAWPPPGVVPINSLLSVDLTGWSIQSDTINLSNAQVAVQSGGTNLPVTVAQVNGYGANFKISFKPAGWHSTVGNTYTVSVTGISSPIQYSVTVVGCY